MKRFLFILMAILLTFAGCAPMSEDTVMPPYPTYEEFLAQNEGKTPLIWYMNCKAGESLPLAKINEYLAELGKEYAVYINGHHESVEMLPVLLSDIESGKQVDIISTAIVDIYKEGFTSAYHQYSYEGYFLPITDYLKTTDSGKELYELMPEGYWRSLDVNGEIYGLTSHGLKGSGFGCAVNKELADKYGYDTQKPLLEQLDIVKKVQEDMRKQLREGEKYYACTLWADLAYPEYQPKPIGCIFGAYYDEETDSIKRITEDKEWLEQIELVNTLANELGMGLQGDNPQRLESFITVTNCESCSVPQWGSVGSYGRETPDAYRFFEGGGFTTVSTATGISAKSQNAGLAFDFLATFKTDKYLNELLSYGYITADESGTIPIEALSYRALNLPNKIIASPMYYEGADYNQWYKSTLEGELPAWWGFAFDMRPVGEAHTDVVARFFGFGFRQEVPFDELIARLDERLTDAGIDEIISEANRQYTAWKTSKQ